MITYSCSIETPLGAMTAAARNDALIGLWFLGQKYYPLAAGDWRCEPERPIFQALRHSLSRYFSGEEAADQPPLAPQGTPFQMTVWRELLKIPYGETTSYGQIARAIARQAGVESMSAQAVGGAVGHNPISILIPCHRVVGSDSRLTGYAGGVERKEALLRLERVIGYR